MISAYGRARERYQNDPAFHQLVNVIRAAIHDMRLTPHECREAAVLAALMYEETKAHAVRVVMHRGVKTIAWHDEDDVPTMTCPRCGATHPDHDGFGFVAHTKPAYRDGCGYCGHPSRDKTDKGWVCVLCGDVRAEGGAA